MSTKKRNGSSYHPPIYKSYVFRTKDPTIDELRTKLEDDFGARITRKHLKAVHDNGGPSIGAMSEWFFGKTLRPQSASLEAAGRSQGFKRVWVKMKPEDK